MTRTYISLILALLLWGSMGIFVRQVSLPSQEIILIRYILGSLFLLLIFLLRRQKPDIKALKKCLPLLAISGVAMGVNGIFLFKAYVLTTISAATLAYYCAPLLVMAASVILLKEKLTWIKAAAITAAMFGMFLLNGTGEMAGPNPTLGLVFGLAAAVLYATVTITNKFLRGVSGLEAALVQLILAIPLVLIYSLMVHRGPWHLNGKAEILSLLMMGIVQTGLCYLIYFSAIQKLPGQTIALLSYIDPASALFFSAIFLHERLTPFQLTGALLILGGAAFGELYKKKNRPAEPG